MICEIIYTAAAYGIVGSLDDAVIVGAGTNVVFYAVFLIGNYIYFKKRKHLFNS